MKNTENKWPDDVMLRHAEECRKRVRRTDQFIARLLREESETVREDDYGD